MESMEYNPQPELEFLPSKQRVAGSSPAGPTSFKELSRHPRSRDLLPGERSGSHKSGITADGRRVKRQHGDGHIYLRRNTYWIKFYRDGDPKYESTGSNDRSVAEDLLALRLSGFDGPVNGQSASAVKRQTRKLGKVAQIAPGTLGAMSELIVATDLYTKGFEVFRSLSPNASCDLVCQRGGQVLRVEVKTSRIVKNRPTTPFIRRGNVFDVLAVVVKGREIVYDPTVDEILPEATQ